MNIKVDKNKITSPMSKIVSITEKKSLMPILSNILIVFGRNKANIYSTDLEISAAGYLDISTEYEKKIVVHGRKFLEILKELDNEEIELEVSDSTLTIRQKKTEFILSLQDPEEFPEIQPIEGKEQFIIDGKLLLDMIKKVIFAVSIDETRYILTGMYLEGKDNSIRMVGTDGFRMAILRSEMKGISNFKGVVIPKRSITEIEKAIEPGEKVKVSIGEKQVQFNTEKTTLITRTIEGTFPDYENVMPANKNILSIDRETILRGLKKVSTIIGRSEPIKATMEKDSIVIEAESDIGRAKETMSAEYGGEKTNMNFNVRFLLDVFNNVDSKKVYIKAPADYGAVLIEGEGEENYKNIVMPIRI